MFNCTPPPMPKLAQVNKATVTLANCMWTTVPQIVYYRLKAWNVVSTLLRASNLSLERNLQQNICTPPCFRTTLISSAAPPGKGRDSVKLTALSTVIPETPRTKDGAQLLALPTNAQNSTKWKHQRLFKPLRQEQGMKLKTRETEHPEG